MYKKNTPDKNEASLAYVREIPQMNKKEASMGCLRETPQMKMKPAQDV